MPSPVPFPKLVFRLLSWPARVAAARRDFALLAAMGEHELRDIGLTRQDLRDATALPLSENATGALARRAQERAELAQARRRPRTRRPPSRSRAIAAE